MYWLLMVCREAVKDAMEANAYANAIVAPLNRVSAMLNERVKAGILPAVSRVGVWSAITSHVLERFVEGISRVKKCTVPGRGLMALDAGAVYSAACKLAPTLQQFLPRDKTYVDSYISAFYFEHETDLLQWLVKQKENYTLRHVKAILTTGIGINMKKKPLKDAMTAIEAMYLAGSASGAGSIV
jgi:hypothetical protein